MSENTTIEPSNIRSLFKGNWDESNVMDDESFRRDLMKLLKEADKNKYDGVLERYAPDQQKLLKGFVGGKPLPSMAREVPCDIPTAVGYQQNLDILEGARKEPADLSSVAAVKSQYQSADLKIYNDSEEKDPVVTYLNVTFSNWGETVINAPLYTCIPTTVHGVQGIVKYAKANDYGVRVSGYRHSWSSIFGRDRSENKQFILISTLKLDRAILGNTANKEAVGAYANRKTELNKIEPITDPSSGLPANQQLVRVGCSTTNEDLRRWCLQEGNYKWTLPLNVIMVEITFGGSNAPICHGAGIETKTLSDLVYAIEYVDANGNIQTISRKDGDLLSTASGCFGLLGVVTHLTLILDAMSVALMKPEKIPVIEAIPPPADMVESLPDKLKESYKKYNPGQIQKFVSAFEKRAFKEYYAEWFWFPLHDKIWINTWSKTNDSDATYDYPSKEEIAEQINTSFLLEGLQETFREGRLTGPREGTELISKMAMDSLPPNEKTKTIQTWLPDALHFRRGIQNTRVRDIEVEIPLPTKDNLDIVRKAWWQAIILAYKNIEACPMRMPLEMRIMGSSDVLMAPQRGNTHGTCAIEVLTPRFMENEWHQFAQAVLDQWMSLRNWHGKPLNIRPHWAKEWERYLVDKKPWLQYLKSTSYKNEISQFKTTLKKIAQKQKWSLDDMRKMFSNQLLDKLLFE